MKRLLFVIMLLFFLFSACSKSKPKGILSTKKMTELMTDVYVLDSYLNTLPIDSSRRLLPTLYQGVFEKYKIDSTAFQQNMSYYYGNPVELDKLNVGVKEVLSAYEKDSRKVDSLQQVHVRDSINTVFSWQRVNQELRNLILDVHLDSTVYTMIQNNDRYFGRVSLGVYRHPITVPAPVVATDSTAVDSVGTSVSLQKPVTQADSVLKPLSRLRKETSNMRGRREGGNIQR